MLTVSVFALTLVMAVLTLCVATLWFPQADTQIILKWLPLLQASLLALLPEGLGAVGLPSVVESEHRCCYRKRGHGRHHWRNSSETRARSYKADGGVAEGYRGRPAQGGGAGD